MENKMRAIYDYAKEKMAQDFSGHGFDHILRVVANVERLLETETQADAFVTKAAAYLHDTVDDKVVADEQAAYLELHNFLISLQLSESQVTAILDILHNMSFSKSLDKKEIRLSLEGQLVQDADRLDALGAVGILRTAYFGGKKGHPIYDPEIQSIDYQSKSDYRKGSTVINHFYEKLLLLAATMNTEAAKIEGQRRTEFMENFLKEFFYEWPKSEK
ncbi:HD domain-containing protein [Enterococcus sp. HY326]|uniref:HD domain-containing protein n=1 Tax=Enterococcus sp. HY326 TaxID=2971265 RepID=UPI00223EEE66|nr:HD domain-containing protein [Enterococcus sp. HY326]